MSLKEQINKDFVEAFKARNDLKKSTLSILKSKITEGEKTQNNSELTDDEVLKIIITLVKQRKQSIVEFEKGGREDLVLREKEELSYLENYLPSQMSEEEIKTEATLIINSLPSGNRNMIIGKTTGMMNKKFPGKFDNKELSKILSELVTE